MLAWSSRGVTGCLRYRWRWRHASALCLDPTLAACVVCELFKLPATGLMRAYPPQPHRAPSSPWYCCIAPQDLRDLPRPASSSIPGPPSRPAG